MYTTTGNTKGSYGCHTGAELDNTLAYTFARTLSGGAGYAHVYPEEFLKHATKAASYNYPYVFFTYAF